MIIIIRKYRVFYHETASMSFKRKCLGVYETEQEAREEAGKFLNLREHTPHKCLDTLIVSASEFNSDTFEITDTIIYDCEFWNKYLERIPYEELEKP